MIAFVCKSVGYRDTPLFAMRVLNEIPNWKRKKDMDCRSAMKYKTVKFLILKGFQK